MAELAEIDANRAPYTRNSLLAMLAAKEAMFSQNGTGTTI